MQIRLFIEGGGDGRTRRFLRQGFHRFLRSIVDQARDRRIEVSLNVCGTRRDAFDDFQASLRDHSGAVNVLLVDSEGPVITAPWQHLRERDGDRWEKPTGAGDDQCHLMVQVMESWFVADTDALEKYYGQGFQRSALSRSSDVESVDKQAVLNGLRAATRNTKTKGEYHKTRHAPDLLQLIDPNLVRSKARHCERLFKTLAGAVGGEV